VTPPKPGANGWAVQQAQLLGTNDNSLGPVAGSSPTDIWAVGDYLPDNSKSNQDATLTFAEHYNGAMWTVSRTPNAGVNFSSFYGLAASGGQAWAVGEYLNSAFQDRALVEVWNGHAWSVADVRQPGSQRDMMFAASAISKNDVWVVGDQEGSDGVFETLAEHWDGHRWAVTPTPNPGRAGNHLYAVDAVGPNDAWAVGQSLYGSIPDQALIEHWDGHHWTVLPVPPSRSSANELLDTVTVTPQGNVWAAGEEDSPAGGGQPFILSFAFGHGGTAGSARALTASALPKLPDGANWSNLYGITAAGGSVWVDGTYVDPATDNNNALVLRESGGTWSIVGVPQPGSGSNLPGGLASIGGHLWLSGVYDDGNQRLPLIETR
jgi:hypothetical protein